MHPARPPWVINERRDMLDREWRKASASNPSGNCLEARLDGDMVEVRDSKDPGPVLRVTRAAWEALCSRT
jgi:hypothetical protein